MAKLIIYEETHHADTVFEAFELSETRILIGADHDNQLILQAPEIDATHASLELREHHWFLQDLGGPGGTSVNGRLIQGPCLLHHDDLIELGPVKMRFHNLERGVTREVLLGEVAEITEDLPEAVEVVVSGRVWFATLAGFTIIIILGLVALLLIAYFLGLLTLADIIPFGG